MYIYIIYVSEKVTGLSEAILLREAYTHTHTHTHTYTHVREGDWTV